VAIAMRVPQIRFKKLNDIYYFSLITSYLLYRNEEIQVHDASNSDGDYSADERAYVEDDRGENRVVPVPDSMIF
jgi:hypothetical protein